MLVSHLKFSSLSSCCLQSFQIQVNETVRNVEQLVSWMVMRFRQRVAWLLLAAYLIATACGLYYIFEISAQFGVFAVEHAEESHQEIENPLRPLFPSHVLAKTAVQSSELTLWVGQIKAKLWSVLSHVADIPVPMIGLLTLVLYLQIFCSLWICTRPDGYLSGSRFWPVLLFSSLVTFWRSNGVKFNRKHNFTFPPSTLNGFKHVTYDL